MVYVVVFTIICVASIVQASLGFGSALIAVPLLTLATDPRTAVVGLGIGGILLPIALAIRERAHAQWRVAFLIIGAAVLGMPIGLVILRYTPERILTALIAVAALVCTVLVWRRVRFGGGRTGVGVVGVLTGVLATATGTNGPPLVAAFQALGYDPRTFRATISAVFMGTGVLGVVGFFLAGTVTVEAAWVSLTAVPATGVGWWAGEHVFRRFDERRFRQVILGALGVISVVTLIRAVTV